MSSPAFAAPLSLDDPALLDTIALYIHIPFCHVKCHYCDFNSYAGLLGWRTPYVTALIREIMLVGEAARLPDGTPRRCRTIFFGGGTPSLMRAHEIAAILAATHSAFTVATDAEVTLEANPGTIERGQLAELRATGLTRLSMGAQSFDAGLLRWMGRIHTPEEIITAVQAARAAGFTNLNLDFIFALPDQTMVQWQDTLMQALALAPEHLSLYSLIVEPTTPLFDWVETGKVTPASEDIAADMYQFAQAALAQAGYQQYEISNWARDDHRCQHNLVYWHNQPYIGVGAGAHSSFGGRRYANLKPVEAYVRALQGEWKPMAGEVGIVGGPVEVSEVSTRNAAMSETAILALRLNEGLSLAAFAQRFGTSVETVFGAQMAELLQWGILEISEADDTRRLRLTERGRLVGNEAFERFLLDER